MDIVIGIILIIAAIFLVIAVLLQAGKDKGLSGAISGSTSDTYYGKNKGSSRDRILSKLTTVISIVFVALVLVSFIIQDDADLDKIKDQLTATDSESSSVVDSKEDTDGTTDADSSVADTTTDDETSAPETSA